MDPTQRRVDQDLANSIDLFRRSRVGEVAALEACRLQSLLVAVDGSSQDQLTIDLARGFQQRWACRLSVVDARERRESSPHLADSTAQSLNATPLHVETGAGFEQILRAADQAQPDLIMLPCPYGRELESVGPDSTGTVIDVLLSRSTAPLLAVRRPFQPKLPLFEQVFLALTSENEAEHAAARWAATLVAPQGHLTLMLILEDEFAENMRQILKALESHLEISDNALEQALVRSHVRLHRSLEKTASASDFAYRMEMHSHESRENMAIYQESAHPLLVLALEHDDHRSQGEVHDRIRHSPNSVLIVGQ